MGITVKTESVTPKRARELLDANTGNRKLSASNVKKLSGAITRGEWEFNGDAIRVADDGTLLDGQHRLHAVIQSGQPIQTLVVSGLPKRVQKTMDVGTARTLADVLEIRGETSSRALAAGVSFLFRLHRGEVTKAGQSYPTHTQGLALLEDHPRIRDRVTQGTYLSSSPLRVPQGVGVGLGYALHETSSDLAELFMKHLDTGAGLAENDPILHLRERLQKRALKSHGKEHHSIVGAWFIKCWNAWVNDEEMRLLRYSQTNESYPLIEGYPHYDAEVA